MAADEVRLNESDSDDLFVAAFNRVADRVFCNAVSKGFWPTNLSDRNDGEAIALIHSELSEALEAIRTVPPPASKKIEGFSNLEEEFADAIIRIMDFAAARGLRLGEAVLAKHRYNTSRPFKHGKNF